MEAHKDGEEASDRGNVKGEFEVKGRVGDTEEDEGVVLAGNLHREAEEPGALLPRGMGLRVGGEGSKGLGLQHCRKE